MGMLPKPEIPKLKPEFVLQSFSEVYDWGLRDLNVPEIHKQTLGEGIKIAVVDSGKSDHFETIENTIAAKNFSKESSVSDKNGHSTFVSGIIAARKNLEGVIGVAPNAQLYFASNGRCGTRRAICSSKIHYVGYFAKSGHYLYFCRYVF